MKITAFLFDRAEVGVNKTISAVVRDEGVAVSGDGPQPSSVFFLLLTMLPLHKSTILLKSNEGVRELTQVNEGN